MIRIRDVGFARRSEVCKFVPHPQQREFPATGNLAANFLAAGPIFANCAQIRRIRPENREKRRESREFSYLLLYLQWLKTGLEAEPKIPAAS